MVRQDVEKVGAAIGCTVRDEIRDIRGASYLSVEAIASHPIRKRAWVEVRDIIEDLCYVQVGLQVCRDMSDRLRRLHDDRET